MERLNFENLGFVKMKKKLDFTFHLLLEMISQLNSIHSYIRLSDSNSTTSNFFWQEFNLKCDCKLIKIPYLFLENSFANIRIQPCMYGSEKNFDVCIFCLKTKRVEMKTRLQCLHFILPLLSYVF